MMEGHVDPALRALISIDAVKSDDSTEPLTAIIDTGFNGELTLSREQIQELDFPQIGTRDIDLGDDSTATTEVHLGVVLWDGEPRPVMVLRAGDTPLVGMELMEQHRLTIDVHRGGKLELEALL
jgi:clan AA aspartic protease